MPHGQTDSGYLDPALSELLKEEVQLVRGLVMALQELNTIADERPVSRAADVAVQEAIIRQLEIVDALDEGYTDNLGMYGLAGP